MKKFGKVILFLSTLLAGFAGAYYYFVKKEKPQDSEEDVDDYEDLDAPTENKEAKDNAAEEERSYVSLNPEQAASAESGSSVEEYFDDDDDDDSSLDAM